jgi:hypothetical protein
MADATLKYAENELSRLAKLLKRSDNPSRKVLDPVTGMYTYEWVPGALYVKAKGAEKRYTVVQVDTEEGNVSHPFGEAYMRPAELLAMLQFTVRVVLTYMDQVAKEN